MLIDEVTVASASDVRADWLAEVVDASVTNFRITPIGTGQMSDSYRVDLGYRGDPDGPASVVLKVSAADPTSRKTGADMGLYEREVRFYAEIAPTLGGPVAPCYHAAFDADKATFALVLGDAHPSEVGNEIAGTTVDRARLAVTELGRLQGAAMSHPDLAATPWLNRPSKVNGGLLKYFYDGFLNRYGPQITPRHREVCAQLVAGFDAYQAAHESSDRPRGLVHGDFRLDNLLFGTAGADRAVTVVDWQTVSWEAAMTDLAYFMGCALTVSTRREHAEELMSAYHEALGTNTGLSLADIREGVRRQSFFGVMLGIMSSMLVQRTDRGDELFATLVGRHCEQALDMDALPLLA